ncbi:MAG: DUF1217 domain-containing protein [Rhodospirillales bacterium]|nr:DUF1217 domain-containing protein [Rhodospirillales bacterium]
MDVSAFGTTPAFALYQRIARSDSAKLVAQFSNAPAVQREIEYYKTQIAKVQSVDDLIKDRRLLSFVLSAFALDPEIQYPGRVKAVITSKTLDPASLANRLRDPRYKDIATTLGIGDFGISNVKISDTINKVVDQYVTNEYEKNLGKQNPALREAAYFKRRIGAVKNVYEILGDNVLRQVVTSTLGLPKEIALQSIEKQAELVGKGFDIGKINNPAYVDRFVQRFLISKDRAALDGGGGSLAQLVTPVAAGGGRLSARPAIIGVDLSGLNIIV